MLLFVYLSFNSDSYASNFNGSNTFGSMKICSRRVVRAMSVNQSVKSGGIIGISSRFSLT